MTTFRPTLARIDLDAIRHNVRTLKPESAELMAVVKANGYGHGDVPVARAALEAGATWLGVALVEEGIRLRDAGVDAPILVLTEFPSGSERDALAADLTPTLYSDAGLDALVRAAGAVGRHPRVHVKIDTGMHRVGLRPEDATRFVSDVAGHGLEVEGVWTHLAKAEDLDDPSTEKQLAGYRDVLAELDNAGVRPRYRHAANSAAAIAVPDAHLDLVRIGVATYGVSPGPALDGRVGLLAAMSLRSRVALVKRVRAGEAVSYGLRYRLERDSRIATIPIGYADGYMRALSGKGWVLLRGKRYRVAGTVTMDQLLVDVGDDPAETGDEVVLFGRQGEAELRAEEVAGWAGTIGYEVVCAVSERVPRAYVGA